MANEIGKSARKAVGKANEVPASTKKVIIMTAEMIKMTFGVGEIAKEAGKSTRKVVERANEVP